MIASEMLQIGTLTHMEQAGIRARNPHNYLLAMSDSRPIGLIKKAATSNKVSNIEGSSANAVVGQVPRIGTKFNSLILNEAFID